MASLMGLEGGAEYDDNTNGVSNTDSELPILSVSEALRQHGGALKVQGMISSISPLCKMIDRVTGRCQSCNTITSLGLVKPEFAFEEKGLKRCSNCEDGILILEFDYFNAVLIELMDSNTFSDIERLTTIVFDDDTKDILVGEKVIVTGSIYIMKSGSRNHTKLYPCLYSNSIEYESKQDLVQTEKDKEAIRRFIVLKGDKIIDELVKMVAPSVIGYNHAKEGLLLAASSAGNDLGRIRQGKQRSRINVLLVGEPGNAKSVLLRASIRLVPGSRYETCQNSSGKSITAIIVKENGEREFLRLGPVPLARNGICALNELGNMPFEDQAHLLDVMEEGEFTITKYAINAKIASPTVIVASSNPTTSYWINSEKVSADELPISKTVLDRFDLMFTFRTVREEIAIREYAHQKSDLIDGTRRTPDYYRYLTRHIMYSKEFDPYLSNEAKIMLSEYYVRIAKRFGSPRTLETVYRIAKAISRLKLKNVVDAHDARETMQFYNIILHQYDEVVSVSSNPRHTTFNECLSILEENQHPFVFEELIGTVCKRNEYAKVYVGPKHKLQDNKKLRPIADMLLNYSSVKCLKQKPLVLQWYKKDAKSRRSGNEPNDQYDQYDPKMPSDNKNNSHDKNETEKSKIDCNAIRTDHKNNYTSSKSKSYEAYRSDEFDGPEDDSYGSSHKTSLPPKIKVKCGNLDNDTTTESHVQDSYNSPDIISLQLELSGEEQKALSQIIAEIRLANGEIVNVDETIQKACKKYDNIRLLLGNNPTQKENKIVKKLCVAIVRHPNIRPDKNKPQLLVKWISEPITEGQQ